MDAWWRHDMEHFSFYWPWGWGDPSVPGGIPSKRASNDWLLYIFKPKQASELAVDMSMISVVITLWRSSRNVFRQRSDWGQGITCTKTNYGLLSYIQAGKYEYLIPYLHSRKYFIVCDIAPMFVHGDIYLKSFYLSTFCHSSEKMVDILKNSSRFFIQKETCFAFLISKLCAWGLQW